MVLPFSQKKHYSRFKLNSLGQVTLYLNLNFLSSLEFK